MGAQYVTTIFLAQRSIETMVKLEAEDLVWEESDTVEFSYLREVFVEYWINWIFFWVQFGFIFRKFGFAEYSRRQ